MSCKCLFFGSQLGVNTCSLFICLTVGRQECEEITCRGMRLVADSQVQLSCGTWEKWEKGYFSLHLWEPHGSSHCSYCSTWMLPCSCWWSLMWQRLPMCMALTSFNIQIFLCKCMLRDLCLLCLLGLPCCSLVRLGHVTQQQNCDCGERINNKYQTKYLPMFETRP